MQPLHAAGAAAPVQPPPLPAAEAYPVPWSEWERVCEIHGIAPVREVVSPMAGATLGALP